MPSPSVSFTTDMYSHMGYHVTCKSKSNPTTITILALDRGIIYDCDRSLSHRALGSGSHATCSSAPSSSRLEGLIATPRACSFSRRLACTRHYRFLSRLSPYEHEARVVLLPCRDYDESSRCYRLSALPHSNTIRGSDHDVYSSQAISLQTIHRS